MITTECAFLKHRHASEFGTPDDEGVCEQSSLFQIADECSGGLIHDATVDIVLFAECLMSIPVEFSGTGVGSVEQLDEPHTLFDEFASEDAVAGVTGADRIGRVIGSVHAESVGRFGAEVCDVWYGGLHAGGQFVAGDTSGQFRVEGVLLQVLFIEQSQESAGCAVSRGRCGAWWLEIANGLAGTEGGSLEDGGQETGAPVIDAGLGDTPGVRDRDERGQVLVFCTEGPGHPGSDAGESVLHEAGGEKVFGGAVGIGFAGERVHEGEIIDQFSEAWQHIGDHFSALSAGAKAILWSGEISGGPLESDCWSAGHWLAVESDQFRFVVPCFELAAGSGAEHHQHIAGFGWHAGAAGGMRCSRWYIGHPGLIIGEEIL